MSCIEISNVDAIQRCGPKFRPDAADGNAAVRHRILIVDDISDNRTILTRRFQRHGFEVVEADNGLKAIELIEQGNSTWSFLTS